MKPPPQPPKSCPICRVAMQAERKDKVIEFRCQRCGASVIVAPTGKDGGHPGKDGGHVEGEARSGRIEASSHDERHFRRFKPTY